MKSLKDYLPESEFAINNPVPGDVFEFELSTDTIVETLVTELDADGTPIVELDETAIQWLSEHGAIFEDSNMPPATDSASPISGNAFAPYHRKYDPREWFRTDVKHKDDEDEELIARPGNLGTPNTITVKEADYHGHNVPLGKKMAGDVKKSKVYVRKPNGNIVKVNFGDKNMRIKKSNPKRRKSFRARHHCENPGPRWKARYWSCRSW